MLISVTKPWGEHVMKAHLHGLASFIFQLEKDGEGGEAELCSQEMRMETSWFAVKAGVKRRVMKKKSKEKNDEEEEEEEEEEDCLELGIDDICLNFQTFLLGFASLGFAASLSVSLSLTHTQAQTQTHTHTHSLCFCFLALNSSSKK
jgi:hypothetical protein